ncbi:MAG: 50S ribosomal protein L29 [Bacteroidales bacterium]|nr:50S ribosomal protein L29 [Bacteroidales bacterium]
MKTSEINELTDKEIAERIEAERLQLVKLRMNHSISELENPMQIKQTRKNIARLLTVQRQRELKQNK